MSYGRVTQWGYAPGKKPPRCAECKVLFDERFGDFKHRSWCSKRVRAGVDGGNASHAAAPASLGGRSDPALTDSDWDRIDTELRGGMPVHREADCICERCINDEVDDYVLDMDLTAPPGWGSEPK